MELGFRKANKLLSVLMKGYNWELHSGCMSPKSTKNPEVKGKDHKEEKNRENKQTQNSIPSSNLFNFYLDFIGYFNSFL